MFATRHQFSILFSASLCLSATSCSIAGRPQFKGGWFGGQIELRISSGLIVLRATR